MEGRRTVSPVTRSLSGYKSEISRERNSEYVVNIDDCDLSQEVSVDQFSFGNQFKMPRPCYYMLRFLGVWQPRNCHWIFDVYSMLSYFILVASMFLILGRALNFLPFNAFYEFYHSTSYRFSILFHSAILFSILSFEYIISSSSFV